MVVAFTKLNGGLLIQFGDNTMVAPTSLMDGHSIQIGDNTIVAPISLNSVSASNICAHFNPTFEDPIESMQKMNSNILDLGSGGKYVAVCNGKPFSKIIRDREGRFKNFCNARVPLSDSMNSIVELIRSQVEDKFEEKAMHKAITSREKSS
ncbi:hypothetical protein Godav_010279 [Gossypium davidsonii]|uniref:Uncharacterized protein n=1 Tax=Gossypium davidsonii TaxID=34287 RepID=A0A7J8SHG8_GOSDV|nr:hypothetical protein [Gossypium davidsonii]